MQNCFAIRWLHCNVVSLTFFERVHAIFNQWSKNRFRLWFFWYILDLSADALKPIDGVGEAQMRDWDLKLFLARNPLRWPLVSYILKWAEIKVDSLGVFEYRRKNRFSPAKLSVGYERVSEGWGNAASASANTLCGCSSLQAGRVVLISEKGL